jgi:hypothetical protein
VIGGFVTIWAEKTRELRYTVSPTRTSIVKAGATSALQVSHEGRPVTTDVSAVQIQVWNEGRESIRHQGNMLEPLIISTADGTSILEATIRQQTRPKIVDLALDDAQKDQGRIGVSWKILEQEDGGIIQLIIAGQPDVKVKAEGVVEGKRPVREIVSFSRGTEVWVGLVIGLSFVLFALVSLILLVQGFSRSWPGWPTPSALVWTSSLQALILWILGSLVIGVGILGWTLYNILSGFAPTSPLAF